MNSSRLTRLGGLATVLGAALFVFFGYVFFVHTHGTTPVNRQGRLFGIGGTGYCRMQIAWPALLAVGLIALRDRHFQGGRNLARIGLNTSLVALGMQFLSTVLQCWLKDPENPVDFASIPLTLGFYLGALSYLVLAVGMVMLGIAARRSNALSRWSILPLVIGLLVMPTLVFEFSTLSTGTRAWDLIYTASRLPLALCCAMLGYVLWTDHGRAARATPGTHPVRQD